MGTFNSMPGVQLWEISCGAVLQEKHHTGHRQHVRCVSCCLAQQLAGKHRLSQTQTDRQTDTHTHALPTHAQTAGETASTHLAIPLSTSRDLLKDLNREANKVRSILCTFFYFFFHLFVSSLRVRYVQWQAKQQCLEKKPTHLAILSKGVTTSRDLLKALSRKALGRRSMTSLAESMASAACSRKGLTKFSTDALMALDTAVCT